MNSYVSNKLERLSLPVTSIQIFYFEVRQEPNRVVHQLDSTLTSLLTEGGLLALPANIRLGQKWLMATNTLAYYRM